MADLPKINDPLPLKPPKTRNATVTVHCYNFTDNAIDALFDRVADAAHALDEEVMCSGVANITQKHQSWRHKLAARLIK